MVFTKEQHGKVMSMFIPPKGIDDVYSYRTQSILEYDSTGQWGIMIGYGYDASKKHIMYSNPVKFSTMEIAMNIMQILNQFKGKCSTTVVDSLDFLGSVKESVAPLSEEATKNTPVKNVLPSIPKDTIEAEIAEPEITGENIFGETITKDK